MDKASITDNAIKKEIQTQLIQKVTAQQNDLESSTEHIQLISDKIEGVQQTKTEKDLLNEEEIKCIMAEQKFEGIVNLSSVFASKFYIKEPIIELVRDNDQQTWKALQLLGKIPISQKKINYFTLIKGAPYCFGIIHPKWIKDENSFAQNRRECVLYNGGWQKIYESGNGVGKGNPIREG